MPFTALCRRVRCTNVHYIVCSQTTRSPSTYDVRRFGHRSRCRPTAIPAWGYRPGLLLQTAQTRGRGPPPCGTRWRHTGGHTESKVKLLDQTRQVLRLKHMSLRTEEAYLSWVRRFILFHDKRHPKDMGAPEIRAFLSHLAIQGKVAASTQNGALNALVFLYRHVLKQPFPELTDLERAKRPRRVPTVFTRGESALWRRSALDRMRVAAGERRRFCLSSTHGTGGKRRAGPRYHTATRARGAITAASSKSETRMPGNPGCGNTSFPPPNALSIHGLAWSVGTTYPKRCCKRRCSMPYTGQAFRSTAVATPYATALPRICWKMAMISVPCRNSWGTKTSALP